MWRNRIIVDLFFLFSLKNLFQVQFIHCPSAEIQSLKLLYSEKVTVLAKTFHRLECVKIVARSIELPCSTHCQARWSLHGLPLSLSPQLHQPWITKLSAYKGSKNLNIDCTMMFNNYSF